MVLTLGDWHFATTPKNLVHKADDKWARCKEKQFWYAKEREGKPQTERRHLQKLHHVKFCYLWGPLKTQQENNLILKGVAGPPRRLSKEDMQTAKKHLKMHSMSNPQKHPSPSPIVFTSIIWHSVPPWKDTVPVRLRVHEWYMIIVSPMSQLPYKVTALITGAGSLTYLSGGTWCRREGYCIIKFTLALYL